MPNQAVGWKEGFQHPHFSYLTETESASGRVTRCGPPRPFRWAIGYLQLKALPHRCEDPRKSLSHNFYKECGIRRCPAGSQYREGKRLACLRGHGLRNPL